MNVHNHIGETGEVCNTFFNHKNMDIILIFVHALKQIYVYQPPSIHPQLHPICTLIKSTLIKRNAEKPMIEICTSNLN